MFKPARVIRITSNSPGYWDLLSTQALLRMFNALCRVLADRGISDDELLEAIGDA